MKWIKCADKLPKIYEVVWIYWRDREVLLGCKLFEEDENSYPSEQWYSFADDKCRSSKYWQPVDGTNYDKPDPPEDI